MSDDLKPGQGARVSAVTTGDRKVDAAVVYLTRELDAAKEGVERAKQRAAAAKERVAVHKDQVAEAEAEVARLRQELAAAEAAQHAADQEGN